MSSWLRPSPSVRTDTGPVPMDWTPVEKAETKKLVRRALSASKPQSIPLLRTGKVENMIRVRPGKGKPKPARRNPGWRNITAGSVADYGLKAWNLAKHIATLINVENKTWDVDGSGGTALTTTPTVVNLSNIAQGSDFYNRIGDSILGQSIEFRASLSSSSANASHRVRVLIVCDKLQRGVDPVLGDVLQGGTDPMTQPYLEPQDQRFDILYDQTSMLSSPGAALATSGTSTAFIPLNINLPSLLRKWNKHIKYQNTTGADASNWVGGLYLMAVCGNAADGPTLRYTFRLRFTDN